MDVSRIEAISPRQIEWRKLTAPEIIKYEQQGVEVPSQYLQWAQEFLNDVNSGDSDETTYESANSQTTVAPSAESAATTTSSTDASTEPDEGTEVEEEPKTAAQEKRENMEASGATLIDVARVFIGDSRQVRGEALESAALMSTTAKLSNNEIQALDNYMKELLSKAEATQTELKNEVKSVNDGENDAGALGKINRLNSQLQRLGADGQANIAGVEGDLNVYESTINAQSGVILNTLDFGTETIGVGQDLLASIRGRGWLNLRALVFGVRAEASGHRAVNASETASAVQEASLSTNSDNISKAQSYKGELENVTGVAGIAVDTDKKNTSDEAENDPAKSNATETDKVASADLDKILKAKIRKGENVGNDQLA